MWNREGSVPLGIIVGMLALTSLIISIMLVSAEKYSNVQMNDRTTGRYIAESAIDIQKYFLHNKLSNKEIHIYFYEDKDINGNTVRKFFKSTNLFDSGEIKNGTISDIKYATQRVLEENNRYGAKRDMATDIRLYSPEKPEDTAIDLLCTTGAFFTEEVGSDTDNMRCELADMRFQSEVTYLGGGIRNTFKVSNISVIRDTFYREDTSNLSYIDIEGELYPVGVVKAKIDTENLKITTESFQDIRGGGVK